nr:YihY/virulence factor BrkB family protein [Oscillospiraceae bacterium]
WLNIPDIAGRLIDFMEYSGLITVAAMTVIILLTYTYLQGVRRKMRFQLPGTLFSVLLWLAFSSLFELFIKRFWQASSLYGSLASVFLAAMWLKSIVMILFYGAALNEALIRRKREKEE